MCIVICGLWLWNFLISSWLLWLGHHYIRHKAMRLVLVYDSVECEKLYGPYGGSRHLSISVKNFHLFKIAESVFSFYLKLHNFKQVEVFYWNWKCPPWWHYNFSFGGGGGKRGKERNWDEKNMEINVGERKREEKKKWLCKRRNYKTLIVDHVICPPFQ